MRSSLKKEKAGKLGLTLPFDTSSTFESSLKFQLVLFGISSSDS